jgi:hypothetical protein
METTHISIIVLIQNTDNSNIISSGVSKYIRGFNLKQENYGTIIIETVGLIIYLNLGTTNLVQFTIVIVVLEMSSISLYIRSSKHVIHYMSYFIS